MGERPVSRLIRTDMGPHGPNRVTSCRSKQKHGVVWMLKLRTSKRRKERLSIECAVPTPARTTATVTLQRLSLRELSFHRPVAAATLAFPDPGVGLFFEPDRQG